MLIETSRTRIRSYTEDDVHLVLPIFTDPTTMTFWPQPLSAEAVASWVRRNSESFQASGLGRMLVEHKETDAVIGDCGIVQGEINGQLEYDLGYIIHHPYWRQGFGLECAQACLDYGMRTLGLKRIVANMAHNHVASMRVAEKLGMQREATFYNPRNRNMLTYLYVACGSSSVVRGS
jgi:RimJ/RimL family protein N-acetyltransferase